MFCSEVMCIGLLSSEFSTVNTGFGGRQARIQTTSPVFWDTVRTARKSIEMHFQFLT